MNKYNAKRYIELMVSISTYLRSWLCISLITIITLSCNNQSAIQQTWICVESDLVSEDVDPESSYSWSSPEKELWHFTADSLFTMGMTDCYSNSYVLNDKLIILNDSLIGEIVYSTKDSLSVLSNNGMVANAFVPYVSGTTKSKTHEDIWLLLVSKSWSMELDEQTWVLNFKSDRYLSACGYKMSLTLIDDLGSEYYDNMWWGLTDFQDCIILNFGSYSEWNFKVLSWSKDRVFVKYLLDDFRWQDVIFVSKQ